jgi:hypothetical protein
MDNSLGARASRERCKEDNEMNTYAGNNERRDKARGGGSRRGWPDSQTTLEKSQQLHDFKQKLPT